MYASVDNSPWSIEIAVPLKYKEVAVNLTVLTARAYVLMPILYR